MKNKLILLIAAVSIACTCNLTQVGATDNSTNEEQTDKCYVVTCIGDSSPNGSCLGHIATAPNCSPNTKLKYTHKSTYTLDDGTVLPLDGAVNGESRVGYRCCLPEGVTPEEYEKDALKAYPVIVAETMNGVKPGSIADFDTFYAETDYRAMSAATIRSGDVLYALDRKYYQDDGMWNLPITEVKRKELASAVDQRAIEDADCIILSVGANDVFAGPIYEMILSSSDENNRLTALKNAVEEGTEHFKQNFPRIMDELQKRNSDCTYVVTGVNNPVKGYTLHDIMKLMNINLGIFGNAVPVGNLADKMLNPLNETMQEVADQYSNVIYVDSNGVNLYLDELASGNDIEVPVAHNAAFSADGKNVSAVSGNPLANAVHPTKKGHEEMAARILAAIDQMESENPNAISLDISGIDKVRYVICNGENAEYNISDNRKIITLTGTGEDTVIVKVIGQKGNIPVEKSWNCRISDNGYWAREK